MRIDRLELLAFGPFTDKVLDFSQRPRALQLVHGPNEAGKSSTLRALIGLLYGIDARTTDAHLHEMTKLRLGATLVDELGNRLQVVRRKGLKNTLMDPAEQAIGEGALTPLLGGLDESLFKQMFGLDHERLRQGAEALLRGGGQLGEVLFDASTGGRGVHTLIESLRAEAESLYKQRGRTPELNVALESLRDKRKLRNDAMLLPDAYVAQKTALAEAHAESKQAAALRRELGVEKSQLTRLLQLVPVLARHDAVVAELGQLEAAARQRHEAARGSDGLSEALLEQTVQELNRRFGSVLAQDREQPQQRALLAALAREIEDLRARLGQGLADLHGLDSATRARLRKLVDAERKLEHERAELVRSEAGESEEVARLQERAPPQAPRALGSLPALLAELEREDLAGQLARVEAELDKLRTAIARRKKQLGLALDFAALPTLELPPDEALAELERAFEHEQRERERLQREQTRASEQASDLARKRGELLVSGELATRAQLDSARAERDAAFDALFDVPSEPGKAASPTLLPVALTPARVRAHAAATQRADALADRRYREAQEAAELSRLELAVSQLAQLQGEQTHALLQTAAREQALSERWSSLAAPLGLAQLTARAARPVLLELKGLREQLLEQQQVEDQRAQLEQRAQERARALIALLQAAELGDDTQQVAASETVCSARQSLEAACRRARELCALELERARERSAVTLQLEKLAKQGALRRGQMTVVERELAAAHERYLGELETLGLTVQLAPDELLACFEELTLLAQRKREQTALVAQLEAADLARRSLALDVQREVARSLPPLAQDAAPLTIEQALAELSRVQRARSDAERDETRQRGELHKLGEQLVSLGDGVPLAELRVALATFEPHAARARLEEIEGLLEEQAQRSTELEQSIGRLSAGLELLEQGGSAVALAEDYEQELSHARAITRRYVEVRLALSLLGAQVERYRSEHQQPVLKRAAELFPRLTLQRYRGLTVEFDEQDEPVLSCVVASGKTVRIAALSDGTRDQLYLALRVASIERYFENRPPLPLILDDALIHFDDARARAALEVLGQLAQHTQVLFFTHHARMIDLAREALGDNGVQVHELASRAAPRTDGPLFETLLS